MNTADSRSATSNDVTPLSRARKRRRQQTSLPETQTDRLTRLDALTHQVAPTYDFFFLSLLAGLFLGAALLVQSRALLFLGILLAPFLESGHWDCSFDGCRFLPIIRQIDLRPGNFRFIYFWSRRAGGGVDPAPAD